MGRCQNCQQPVSEYMVCVGEKVYCKRCPELIELKKKIEKLFEEEYKSAQC